MAATARIFQPTYPDQTRVQMPTGMGTASRQIWDSLTFDPYTERNTPIALDTTRALESFSRQAIKPILERIKSLADWPAGWNGYDALPPDPQAIDHAAEWLVQMHMAASDAGGIWNPPNVTASPDGEVVLEWWEGERKLAVYIGAESAEYLKVWGTDMESEMADGNADSFDTCRHLWAWLTQR